MRNSAAAAAKARRELEVGQIGAAVGVEPVLLLGEIVVGDAGAMQRAQRRLGRAEIGGIAMRLGDMQRHAVDPAAHQRVASGEQQRRRDAERAGDRKRAALAPEQLKASGQLHHGTSSSRRSTASTSPASVRKRPRSMVEKTSRLRTTPPRQRPAKFVRYFAFVHAARVLARAWRAITRRRSRHGAPRPRRRDRPARARTGRASWPRSSPCRAAVAVGGCGGSRRAAETGRN